MNLLYAYRYGIVGGVATQLLLRRRALQHTGTRCELFFSQDNGLRQVLNDSDGVHFGSGAVFSRLLRVGRFDAVVVIDSPELLQLAAGPFYRRNAVFLDVHTTTRTGLAYLSDIRPARLAGVMVPTRYSAQLVASKLPATNKIAVVPNILDGETFSASPASPDCPTKLNPQRCRREFVWVGKLDYHKNWRLALVYAAMLRDMFGDVHLYMVGGYTAPTHQAEAFFELAYRLGISHCVDWLDRIGNEELVDLYRRCGSTGGAMLVTSRDESFGMAAAEALLCGCPLITNDLPVLREVFPDSPLVQRVDIWQPEQVRAAAQALENTPAIDEVARVHQALTQRYGPQVYVESLNKLLTEAR